MMRTRILWVLLCGAVLGASCRRVDVRTMAIHVPDMKTAACEEIVLKAVGGVPGVHTDKTRVDRRTRTVVVAYDSLQLSLKNIEFAVADAGFKANDIPARRAAAETLPADCR